MIINSKFKIKNSKLYIKRWKIRRQAAFTLIELLVVMSIVAILAAVSIFALQGAKTSGRDARRKADLETLRSALELYKADCNAYPVSVPVPGNSLTASCTGSSNTYLEEVPADPISGAGYRYCPGAGNLTYILYSHLEDSTTSLSPCGSCNPSPCRYSVRNP